MHIPASLYRPVISPSLVVPAVSHGRMFPDGPTDHCQEQPLLCFFLNTVIMLLSSLHHSELSCATIPGTPNPNGLFG